MSAISLFQIEQSGQWRTDFLAVLPAVRTHARICFRKLRSCDAEEAVAETVASAFNSYVSLARRGKLGSVYPSTLAAYAVHTVRNDRHVGGSQSAKDVMSPLAQRRRNLDVRSLTPNYGGEESWREMTLEDRRVSPADQAAFNIDFEAWVNGFARRDRRIIKCLTSGDGTSAVAGKFGLSSGRISQLRYKFERSWNQFQGNSTSN